MKITIANLILAILPFILFAEATNREEIVIGCLEQIASENEDDFDESNMTQEVSWVSCTQEGFFGKMSNEPSEQLLYRQAFEAVLDRFASNDWNESNMEEEPIPSHELARIALCQVRDMSYTNALSIVRRWALNSRAPHRDEALNLYYRWIPLNAESLAVAGCILTNEVMSLHNERIETIGGLTDRICVHIAHEGKDACYTNALWLLYRSRCSNFASAPVLDNFFVSQIPDYAFSSNRLQTVKDWISQESCTSEIKSFCSLITNQLLNAAQPLPEVESLRGL